MNQRRSKSEHYKYTNTYVRPESGDNQPSLATVNAQETVTACSAANLTPVTKTITQVDNPTVMVTTTKSVPNKPVKNHATMVLDYGNTPRPVMQLPSPSEVVIQQLASVTDDQTGTIELRTELQHVQSNSQIQDAPVMIKQEVNVSEALVEDMDTKIKGMPVDEDLPDYESLDADDNDALQPRSYSMSSTDSKTSSDGAPNPLVVNYTGTTDLAQSDSQRETAAPDIISSIVDGSRTSSDAAPQHLSNLNTETTTEDESDSGTKSPAPNAEISSAIVDDDKTPLKIKVVKGTKYYGPPEFPAYQMMSKPKGYVLIINIINFTDGNKRLGAEIDSDNLKTLWDQMGFESTCHEDLNRKDMEKVITEFANMSEHENTDAVVTIVMSHGIENKKIICADGNRIKEKWIFDQFTNDQCKFLHNKPKLFFLQNCRGYLLDKGVQTGERKYSRYETDSIGSPIVDPVKLVKNPTWTDIFIAYSVVEGYQSIRDHYRGTWFIETLCEIFMNHAHNTHLEELMKKMAKKMRTLEDESGNKQMCSYVNIGLTEYVYFNPGLSAEVNGNYGQ